MKLLLLGIVALVVIAVDSIEAVSTGGHKIVAYWGQNAVYNKHKGRQWWEKDLTEFCKNYNYDVISLAFLNIFFSDANKDKFPGLNFAYHCAQPVSEEYPLLLKCPKIEKGIQECQKNGKKVTISLGGAVGDYGFKSEIEAVVFAYRVYHLFLAGNKLKDLRPFGSAILDGVDLNIENMDSTGNKYYTHFVKELRRLEKSGLSKFMITAAPQCPFPDRYLGPAANKVLGDVPELIDEVYIQFYNNWCQTGNQKAFDMRFRQWMGYSINFNGPLVFIGLPADGKASGNAKHYRKLDEVTVLYKKVKNTPKFGGIMLWDASFDQNSKEGNNGMTYSKYIGKMMKEEDSKTTSAPPKTTKQQVTGSKMTTTSKGSVSCHGKRFGLFQHPTSCNKFIHCSHFVPHVKDCPPGLQFNTKIRVCDWPRNVDCKL